VLRDFREIAFGMIAVEWWFLGLLGGMTTEAFRGRSWLALVARFSADLQGTSAPQTARQTPDQQSLNIDEMAEFPLIAGSA
jgi:hypothetical protein